MLVNLKLKSFVVFTVVVTTLFSCGKPERKQLSIQNSIYDSTRILSEPQADSIFNLINELNLNTGSEIMIIIIDTLNGQKINEYALDQFEKFRIGREEYNDGILFITALKNRQMRIEVGYGLELIIKDEIASRINRDIIAPKFREFKYGLGIYKGLDSIKYLIEKNRKLIGKNPTYYKGNT